MLSVEQNERVTRVGPGTPMGDLLRRYWFPVATNQEIAENPVKPVRLMGENLTLFKDRSGRLGLVAQRCAHRRVDLRHGIPLDEVSVSGPTRVTALRDGRLERFAVTPADFARSFQSRISSVTSTSSQTST